MNHRAEGAAIVREMLVRVLGPRLRPYAGHVAMVMALTAGQSGTGLLLPKLNADIIDHGIATGNLGHIWRIGALMVVVALGQGLLAVIAVHRAALISAGMGRDLRALVFDRVQGFSAREMEELGTASLVTRNTNDVQQVQVFLQAALIVMVAAPMTTIGGILMVIRAEPGLAVLPLVILPPVLAAVAGLVAVALPRFRLMQIQADRLNRILRDQVAGVRVIRAFVRERHERERFEAANADLAAASMRAHRTLATAMPAAFGVVQLPGVAILWFGGHLVAGGRLPVGDLIALVAYVVQILAAIGLAAGMVMLLPRAQASAERIAQVLNTRPAIVDPPSPQYPRSRPGGVAFEEVGFGYPGGERLVLRGLTFELRPGETTGIVGGTGAGKTTVLNLVLRLVDAAQGRVLVNGVDVREQSVRDLRRGLGLVPQQPHLLPDTVAGNLRLGRPEATDAELWQALEVAQARDFVAALPGQLEARITQGGGNLSGGQRQRLSIARALVRRPSIYLLDDCLSGLDGITAARVQAGLRQATASATVILVTQRVSTLLHADRIAVLDGGGLAGIGSHDGLMAGCEPYRRIASSQLSPVM
jgi:ATP-binding cassette, subfamily B, multidrug efflux pump